MTACALSGFALRQEIGAVHLFGLAEEGQEP